MAEVRAGVDALDRELLALLGRRMRFMDAAARIMDDLGQVRDEARKAEVIANVVASAAINGVPPNLARDLYETLVEASIAYELRQFTTLARGQ
ncbi:chorismate mutase [Altererythrobacter soli]|uniref:chorismate mutase n=2 Tax=Croceibacterium soli TaxID=1739690 RepID=A0A6I4UUE3_9SPHN|nr:chorismate mutase [Croceibacterium soli]MXP41143.1 chorismate mutase [Croceibacterium soli]